MVKSISNLFIVGAMKSGTTSLHNYLGEHPEIFMSQQPKETQYFVKELNWSKGEEWYLSIFASANGARIVGESSTDYTKAPRYQGVVERIAQFNPDARIVYIMRDPIERAISHYWWEVRWSAEGRPMKEAVKSVKDIIDTSYYAMQLAPYLETFGRDRVMTLTLEELSANPQQNLAALFEWLEVDPSFVPPSLNRRDNAATEKVSKVWGSSYISKLRGTPAWEALKRIIPSQVRASAIKTLSRPVERDFSDVNQAIDYLRPIQRQQTDELCQLLNRQFPEWKTLYGT
ncbi:sulfotransferase [Oscillatoriales cyanobacterium LEGE 11467]|uniref:Sulfotransferase n=1 Tax=Zarconia navalis LEGE 11467 TaxID=1828826 RepID=A0A928Z8P1_9CYAN|nr:sulfotransferase [Zarconia navalis]MBE9040779.1 sulfotransferase [Zarconia navalis LEGE 11467]